MHEFEVENTYAKLKHGKTVRSTCLAKANSRELKFTKETVKNDQQAAKGTSLFFYAVLPPPKKKLKAPVHT